MMLSLGEMLLARDLEVKGLTVTGEVSLWIMSDPMCIGWLSLKFRHEMLLCKNKVEVSILLRMNNALKIYSYIYYVISNL